MPRTFVVGLDGANWDLIEPWLAAGELPALERIRREGTHAPSRSCLPPVTFPNWKCYSASKNPGKLDVFWFERIDVEAGSIEIMNGDSFRTAELWDYLNRAGLTTGVVNMPTMYPPRSIDGVVVCGGPDAVDGEYRSIDSGYTHPPELEAELEERFGYAVHPSPLLSSDDERGAEVEAILDLLEKRFEVALALFEERDLDFVHVTLFYLNVLQHFFWDDEPTARAWRLVDRQLDRIDRLEGVDLVVMSDHGCAPTTTEFYINEWLAANGYLEKRPTVDTYLQRLGVTRETALRAAKRAGVVDLLAATVPERVQQLIPQTAGAKRERKLEKIDLAGTRALASGQGPVYLNPRFDVERVRERLLSDLRAVTDDAGAPLFRNVFRAEEVYEGPYLDRGPDIVVDMRPGVHVNDGLGGGRVQTAPDRWAAENVRTGIFAASGPSFEAGELDGIDIRDIAPTILASHGVDVPSDADGEVLPVLADPPAHGTGEPIDLGDRGGGAGDEVADRLKQLGYME